MPSLNPSLRELFEAALELPPDQRRHFLDDQCADSAQRVFVERMLDARAEPADDLPNVPASTLAETLGASEPIPALPPGSRIGPFELLGVLGEGGFSTVFRAQRTFEGVRQEVALKLLRRGVYSPDAQRQFRRERQILSQLNHPGIARLIEGGVTETGAAYIALDLVEGVPITAYVREHRLDLRKRLRLFVEVCRAVDAAHRALIVHRDLKPSNVMVTNDGSVKLLDFGIAKLLDTDDDTQTHLPAFTPAYASPEQRSGALITTATDVYALGVLLGEIMTGVRMNAGSTHTPSSEVSEEAEPGVLPATATMTRRQLRGDLDNIVLKAIEADPAQRYASAGSFAEDIERWLAGQPVAAHPPSSLYRARKFVGRHRGGVATTVLFLVAILAALGAALWQATVARQQALIAREQAQRAESMRQFLTGVFQRADPDENKGQPITAHQLLQKGENQISKGTYDRASEADAATLLAHLFVQISDFDSARRLLERALPVGEDATAPRDIRARILIGAAGVEMEADHHDAAIAHAREGLRLLDDSMPAAAELAADAHQSITHSMIEKGDWTGAEALLRVTLRQDTAALGHGTDALIDQWLGLGYVLDYEGKFDESQTAFEHGIAMARDLYGENSVRLAHALNEQGNMLSDRGDFAGAERTLRQALAIRRQSMGAFARETLIDEGNLLTAIETDGRLAQALPQRMQLIETVTHAAQMHPSDLAYFYVHAGTDLRDLGRFNEAESMLRKALAVFDASLGHDSSQSASTQHALGLTLMLLGRYGDAKVAIEKAVEITQRAGAPSALKTADHRILLGQLLARENHRDDALVLIEAAAKAYEHANASDWGRPLALAALSEAQLDTGQTDAAYATAQTSLAQIRKLLPPKNFRIGTPLLALARADLALNRATEAEVLLREALAVRSPPYPASDPRTLEVQVELVNALNALGRSEDARKLRGEIEPVLAASNSPYATILKQRLGSSSK